MEVKWVCNECSSINLCEQSSHMVCYVCGNVRTDERLMAPTETGLAVSEAKKPVEFRFAERIRRVLADFKARLKPAAAAAAPVAEPAAAAATEPVGRRKITDWKIARSPASSKEAYVTAEPVYTEDPPPVLPEAEPVIREDRRLTERIPTGVTPAAPAASEPWPEHRIVFNLEKLESSGCVCVERAEMGGNRGYKLTYRSGTDRFMPLATMKIMGYISYI